MTLNTFFQYLEFEKRLSPNTLIAYKGDLEQFTDYLDRTYQIISEKEVNPTHIRSWMVQLMQEGISPRSINRKLSSLKTFFKFLKKRGQLEENPMSKIISPKSGKRLPVFVNKDQIQHLFEDIDFGQGYEGTRDLAILELFYATGMRRSELIGLQIKDVFFESNYIKVKGKGNKERLIPMSGKINDVLNQYLESRNKHFPNKEDAPLFLTRKRTINVPQISV